MPSRTDEHIDQLIRETIRSHMRKAGEPRPELVWARIQNEIAAPGKSRRSLFNYFACKWRTVGAVAAAICLAAGTIFFYTAPAVLESDTGHKQVAVEDPAPATDPAPSTVPDTAPDSLPNPVPDPLPDPLPDPAPAPVLQEAPHEETETPTPDKHHMTALSGPADESAQVGPAARMFTVSEPETEEGLTPDNARDTVPFPVHYPAYIPPGFTREDVSHETISAQDEAVSITFVHTEEDEATIQFIQTKMGDEDMAAERGHRVEIGGDEGTLRVDGQEHGIHSHLCWHRDDMVFEIHGDVKPAEIIKMAESLQP